MLTSDLYLDVVRLYADYADVLDREDWDHWPGFFTEECVYKITPRENFDRKLPLSTLAFESRGMLMDRVYGIRETLCYDPYYQRHVVGSPILRSVSADRIESEANYIVLRTKRDQMAEVFSAGRYIDVIRREEDGLRFASRICVFDSEMIANSLIYPI